MVATSPTATWHLKLLVEKKWGEGSVLTKYKTMTNGDRCRRSSFGGHSCSGLVPASWWCGVIVAACSRVVVVVTLLCMVSRRGVLAVSEVGWNEGRCTNFRVIIIKTTTNDDIVVVRRLVATSLSATWQLEPIVVVVAWR
jgi:hypothetical protein